MHPILSNRKQTTRRAGRRRVHNSIACMYSPYEILAVATEGGLLEEPWHEAVILDHVNIFLLKSPLPAPQFIGEGVVDGPEGVLARVLWIVRHGAAAADAATTDRRSIDVDDVPSYTRAAPRRGRRRPFRSLVQSPRFRVSCLSHLVVSIPLSRKAVDDEDDDRTRAERRPRAEAVTRRTDRRRYVSRARCLTDDGEGGKRVKRWDGGDRESERDDGTIRRSPSTSARAVRPSCPACPATSNASLGARC